MKRPLKMSGPHVPLHSLCGPDFYLISDADGTEVCRVHGLVGETVASRDSRATEVLMCLSDPCEVDTKAAILSGVQRGMGQPPHYFPVIAVRNGADEDVADPEGLIERYRKQYEIPKTIEMYFGGVVPLIEVKGA